MHVLKVNAESKDLRNLKILELEQIYYFSQMLLVCQ